MNGSKPRWGIMEVQGGGQTNIDRKIEKWWEAKHLFQPQLFLHRLQ